MQISQKGLVARFSIFCGDSWGNFTKNGTNLSNGEFFSVLTLIGNCVKFSLSHWPQWSPPDRQPLQQQLLTLQRTHGIRSWMRLRRYSDNRVNKVSWLRFSLLCICCHLFLCCLSDPCLLQASFVCLSLIFSDICPDCSYTYFVFVLGFVCPTCLRPCFPQASSRPPLWQSPVEDQGSPSPVEQGFWSLLLCF